MRHLRLALALLVVGPLALSLPATPASAAKNTCLDCHEMLEGRLSAPTHNFSADIHEQKGLGCAGCHGGNPNDPDMTAMDPDKGFRGAPERSQIAEFCARCHANASFMKRYNPEPYIFSMAEFRTSVHCKLAAEGDPKVATCTNCHGVHPVRPRKDPLSPVYKKNIPMTCAQCHNPRYMRGRHIPTNQYPLYVNSVHGRALYVNNDLSAPTCNNCHGNHGAVPPNTRDISLVCGNCHGREGELFDQSTVKTGLELEGKRACVTCHSNHDVEKPTDAMIASGPRGLCDRCHTPDSPGAHAASLIVPAFHSFKGEIHEADSVLTHAEQLGMETAPGRESLKRAHDQLVNVRVTLHSFNTAQITTVLSEGSGFANRALDQGRALLRDWRTRRIGMAVSLVVILVLIGLLVLRIRRLERG